VNGSPTYFSDHLPHAELEEEYHAALLLHQQDPGAYAEPSKPIVVDTITIGSDPKFREWYHALSHEEREEFRVHVDDNREAEVNKTCGSARQVSGRITRTSEQLKDIVSYFMSTSCKNNLILTFHIDPPYSPANWHGMHSHSYQRQPRPHIHTLRYHDTERSRLFVHSDESQPWCDSARHGDVRL
jgi:hypothetical protein